jgi:tetratricopeptide (TPR) repeat protein
MESDISFSDAFLAGAFALIFVYLSNIIVILRWPRSAFFYDLILVTGLAGFGLYRETLHKTLAALRWKRLRDEALALELNITRDPENGAYYERLSEVYEKLKRPDKAIEAARLGLKLEPSVRNTLRVKHLEQDRLSGR